MNELKRIQQDKRKIADEQEARLIAMVKLKNEISEQYLSVLKDYQDAQSAYIEASVSVIRSEEK